MIIAVLLSLIILLIPTLLLSSTLNKGVLEVFGIASSCSVLVALLCGIFLENLNAGYCVLVVLSLVCLVVLIIKKCNIRQLLRDKTFWLLIIYICFLMVLYRRIRCTANDEFSHWADIVKIFTIYNDFGTNVNVKSGFSTYPPGMSLFQFIFEKTSILVGNDYKDNLLYVGYHTLLLAFIGPVISLYKDRKTFCLFSILSFLAIPTFYTYIYHSVYIDAFLGTISGLGLAYVICNKERDITYHLTTYSYIFMLVLSKDAGMLYAIFLLLVYLVGLLKNKSNPKYYVYGLLSLLIPKLLWSYETRNTNKAFGLKLNLNDLLTALSGKSNDYKAQTLANFNKRFFSIDLSYPIRYQFLVIGIVLLIILTYISYKKKIKIEASLIVLEYVIYIFGLLVAYLFNFGEYESVGLASYDRYMCIVYTSLYLVVLILLFDVLKDNVFKPVVICILLAYVIFPMPVNYIEALKVNKSTDAMNDKYNRIFDKVDYLKATLKENDKVFFITQGVGYEELTYRYNLRPVSVDGGSIYINKIYDGDIWTDSYTPEEFVDMLINKEYKYLFIHDLIPDTYDEDYSFEREYSSIFSDEIKDGCLYKIDTSKKLLSLVK